MSTDDDSNTNWDGFGIYIAYVFVFVIFTFLLDKCKVFDGWVHSLSLKSQENLQSFLLTKRHIDIEDSNRKNEEHEKNYDGECFDCLCGGKEKASGEIGQYKVEYLSYLLDKPPYLANAPVNSSKADEFVINCGCCRWKFAPGLFNDILLYNFNKHSILGMFATTKGHPFSRAEKRSAFLCQTCMALGFGILVNQLSATEKIILNIFVISPIMVSLNTALYYLLACPCLRKSKERGGCLGGLVSCIEGLGWFLAIPITLGCIAFMMGMVIITAGNPTTSMNMIASFAYSVHVVSSIQEAFLSLLLFLNGRRAFEFKFCYVKFFTLGKYFLDKIDLADWEEGKQYYKSEWRICCCSMLLKIVSYSTVDDGVKIMVKPSKESQVVPIVEAEEIITKPVSSSNKEVSPMNVSTESIKKTKEVELPIVKPVDKAEDPNEVVDLMEV